MNIMIELVGKLPGKCLVTDIYKQPCIEIAKLSTTSAPKFDIGDHKVVSLVSRLLVQCGKGNNVNCTKIHVWALWLVSSVLPKMIEPAFRRH